MALNNFFKINMPYGIMCNNEGRWAAFNREYLPLGQNNPNQHFTDEDFIYTDYGKLTDKFLMGLAYDEKAVNVESGRIKRIFFYNDTSNPSNSKTKGYWKEYFSKIERLSYKQRQD